jgi:ATP-dependent Clp protease ATP-binding subunit ClpB
LDSQPEVIDTLERKQLQLQVEMTALAKEKDRRSNHVRLEQVKQELATLEKELQPLILKHQAEKQKVEHIRRLKDKWTQLQAKVCDAERHQDLAQVADLKYYAIPDVEKQLHHLEQVGAMQDATNATLHESSTFVEEVVREEQIADVVARWTGIPVDKLTRSDRERLLSLRTRLNMKVVGQESAIQAVCDAVLRSRAGLSRSDQPTGSFLFLGPTGVGKTELAKALAMELFDSERHMVRLDMSEYMEAHAVSKLIGAPPGYLGYDDHGGALTEPIRRHPYNVLLLDEIEKAHPKVLNLLLQLLDEGRITDSHGRTVDCTHVVVILTSNIGAAHVISDDSTLLNGTSPFSSPRLLPHGSPTAVSAFASLCLNPVDYDDNEDGPLAKKPRLHLVETCSGYRLWEEQKARVLSTLKKTIRPELLNRLDDIVVFASLEQAPLREIVTLQFQSVRVRLEQAHHVMMTLSIPAMEWILKRSYDPQYGARPLKRFMETHVVTPLSRLVLAGALKANGRVDVVVHSDGARLEFCVTHCIS